MWPICGPERSSPLVEEYRAGKYALRPGLLPVARGGIGPPVPVRQELTPGSQHEAKGGFPRPYPVHLALRREWPTLDQETATRLFSASMALAMTSSMGVPSRESTPMILLQNAGPIPHLLSISARKAA